MAAIEVIDLNFSYGKNQILNKLSLIGQAGQCVGIVGRNGCGKSTLLNILAGMRKPVAGDIVLQGENACKNPRLFRERTGFVPQENTLFDELTVLDNLKLWYLDSKVLKQELANGQLARLGLAPLVHKPIKKLSGGQKKRVSIACALAANPGILILDEPGAALDLEAKAGIMSYLEEYKAQGGCVILTSHEEQELNLCNHLYILKEGTLHETDASLRGEALVCKF